MYRVLSVVTVVLLKSATYNFRELSSVLFVQMVYYLEFSRKEEVRALTFPLDNHITWEKKNCRLSTCEHTDDLDSRKLASSAGAPRIPNYVTRSIGPISMEIARHLEYRNPA